ncbi:MAG: glyoxalase [Elusimicrobia bacterium GWA2_69_24]|nr:MAG: glyoxalase [Elusimicrobia bacterium GWA2_69_24]HBL16176.1 glyoxalase [Elusimicrobiota bacterium]
MEKNVKPIPEGYNAITPVLTVRDADKALDYYQKAFDARELNRMPGPDGKIVHAELKIGNSIFMLCEESRTMGCLSPQSLKGTPVGLYLYVNDADAVFKKAVQSGGTQKEAVQDMFWGDRCGTLTDPFGHVWTVATRKKDLTPKEIAAGAEEFFLQASKA